MASAVSSPHFAYRRFFEDGSGGCPPVFHCRSEHSGRELYEGLDGIHGPGTGGQHGVGWRCGVLGLSVSFWRFARVSSLRNWLGGRCPGALCFRVSGRSSASGGGGCRRRIWVGSGESHGTNGVGCGKDECGYAGAVGSTSSYKALSQFFTDCGSTTCNEVTSSQQASGEVSGHGCFRCDCSFGCGCERECPSGDAKADWGWSSQGQEVAGAGFGSFSKAHAEEECVVRERDRRRRRGGRRWWIAGCIFYACSGQIHQTADKDRICFDSGEKEEVSGVSRGSCIGWDIFNGTDGIRNFGEWEESSCCQTGATQFSSGGTGRDLPTGGTLYDGRPVACRAACADFVGQSVDRTSQQDRQLQDFSSLCVERRRGVGCADSWQHGIGSCSGIPIGAHVGSNCCGPWKLGTKCRAQSRTTATYVGAGYAFSPKPTRWRGTIQSFARPALGGGVLGTPERSGGISESEGQARKEGDGGGHGITKSKRQSKGKGCGKQRKHGLSEQAATMEQPGGLVDASTKTAHVLGSRAPTIAVAPFLNSWPRLLLRSGGALGEFLQSMLNIVPENRDDSTGCGSTWPIPMPYPEAFRSSGTGSMWRKKRLCLQVLVLNWFWLGVPSKCPDILWLGRRLSARQWRIVSTLENLAEDANSLLEVDAMGMGRTAGKIELQDNDLAAIHRACDSLRGYGAGPVSHPCSVHGEPGDEDEDYDGEHGVFVGTAPGSSYVAAKPIVAERLQFGPEPRFDPVPYLDVITAEMYENPRSFSDFKAANPPVGRVRGARGEIKELYKKLALTKRLVPLKSERVDSRFTSGLFAVVKDLERDRLIMDSRPANAAEEGLNKWTQCAASAFNVGQVEIRPGEILVMSGQDIKDFYYQFRIGPERSARNALSGKMSREELAEIFGSKVQIPEEGGFVGLNTLAMGDICACEFAQGSHLGLLLQAGAVRPPELLRYRSPSPRSCFSVGVVIDDLVMLERVLEAGNCGSTISEVRMGRAEQAYHKAGLPTNPKKAFYKETAASFWGISVDGIKGTMRPNPQRLWPLELITWRVVMLGLVTTSLLESLVGSWVSVFMQRRRMLSVLDLCFRAIHSGAAPDHVLRMSPALKDELVSCCVLGTMTVSNLRAAMLPMMKATDASDWGMAAVEASIPVDIAREAARFSLTKSMWSKLLPPSKAWLKVKNMISAAEEMPGGEAYNTHPFWSVLANYPKYEELWRRPYERVCHINIGELAAHLKEEARVGSHHPSSRCCYGLDSQVALGALIKGRSASAGLNALLRRSLAICLGYDFYGAYGYFPSAINRSDGPTRGVPPAPPSIKEPYFWKTLAKGECGQFEEWMNSMGVPDTEAACIAEFAPLGAEQAMSDEEVANAERAEYMEKEEKLTMQKEPGPPTEELDAAEVELSEEAVRLLNSVPSKFVWWPIGASRRFTKPGALDLYSGTAGVARHLLKMGCPFVVVVDWKMGSEADLLQKDVQQLALDLVVHKAVEVAGSALICSSFSKAITPAVRSPRFPRGLPGMRRSMRLKVSQGNAHSDFNATLVVVAEENGVWFWLENPDSSYLWIQCGYARFRRPDSDWLYRADFCRFGTKWRKRTRVATSLPTLRGRRVLCRCNPPRHFQLRGQHPSLRKPWTAVAEPYPRGLAASIARAICAATGWGKRHGDCSKTGGGRIGEARNPGPRRAPVPRRSLESRPVQGQGTSFGTFSGCSVVSGSCYPEVWWQWISTRWSSALLSTSGVGGSAESAAAETSGTHLLGSGFAMGTIRADWTPDSDAAPLVGGDGDAGLAF